MPNFLPYINNTQPNKKNKAIRQFIKKNKLSFLTHFTRMDHLKSILQFGILPASILKSNRTFSSVQRSSMTLPPEWDGLVSMNISFPDYKLFNQLQNHKPSDWVILLIDIRVLTDFPCYFFPERALDMITSASEANQFLTGYQSAADLKALFDDRKEVKRKDLDIPSFYPTDPASEVLSFFPVAPAYITQVFFHSEYKFNQWVLSNTEFAVSQDRSRWACGLQYFSPRSDYTFWKTDRRV
ncbi:MAG: DUF4433 domain-containing protein [Anaerolineaceae bacterium]|nr:DUF4433 domain-containing protein [Anaerolineaceae bacterium]